MKLLRKNFWGTKSSVSSPKHKLFSFQSPAHDGVKAHSPLNSQLPPPPASNIKQTGFCNYSADNGDSSSDHSSEFQELVKVFRAFDLNGDGKISVSELGSVLTSLGDSTTEEEVRLTVKEVDSDGDGSIDLSEFLEIHSSPSTDDVRVDELRAAFDVFDINKDGFITAEELRKVMMRMGEKEVTMQSCCRMIEAVDCDGEGFVNFAEFQKMMQHNVPCRC